ncbi:ankyrin repeat domain-containing protein [Candidatus Avelusimicrobium aviculae]|uniref:ankyrin repeat domain-containing protein n=1 Tax=Candidatus Avelusimicrobium aviculae TaxID=3416206 RepID=UPI003D12B130
MIKKWMICSTAVLTCALAAQAYGVQEFMRQYKDTISIVETNYTHKLPTSGYEREQLFKKEFLMRAAEFGPKELLDKVLSLATSPLQIAQEDKLGRTALFYAADSQFVDSLLNRFLSLETARGLKVGYAAMNEGPVAPGTKAQRFLNKKDDEGATALMILLRDGKISAANRLLERGADPCVKDKDGVTPLHMAVLATKNNNPDGLKILQKVLKACPQNITAKTKDGQAALAWADKSIFSQAYDILNNAAKGKAAPKQETLSWEGKLRAL